MKHTFTKVAAAVALVAGSAAHAAITNANTAPGNSSVLFVAWDNARTTSLTVDLGVNLTDFLRASSFTNSNGPLAYNGSNVSAQWSFGTDSRSVNGSGIAGDYAWSGEFNNFLGSISGGYTWGVVAADNVTGAISVNNAVQNRTVLSTGTPTQANITGLTSSIVLSNSPANFVNFAAASGALGTHASNANGANVATSGGGYLGSVMQSNFSAMPWSYLSNVGATTNVFLAQQFGNPVVYQLGATTTGYGAVDTLIPVSNIAMADNGATFRFDGSTLTYAVTPVPEPTTIAMMLAGLGLIGAIARRRHSGSAR